MKWPALAHRDGKGSSRVALMSLHCGASPRILQDLLSQAPLSPHRQGSCERAPSQPRDVDSSPVSGVLCACCLFQHLLPSLAWLLCLAPFLLCSQNKVFWLGQGTCVQCTQLGQLVGSMVVVLRTLLWFLASWHDPSLHLFSWGHHGLYSWQRFLKLCCNLLQFLFFMRFELSRVLPVNIP